MQLVVIDDEVLAQQRQWGNCASRFEIGERTAEVRSLGEDRQGARAATRVGVHDRGEVGILVKAAGRRRAALELGDHGDPGADERGAEAVCREELTGV